MRTLILLGLLIATEAAGQLQMAPDGSYVQGTPHIAPNGSWTGGVPTLAPNGQWVGTGSPARVIPRRQYVPPSPPVQVFPPNGSWDYNGDGKNDY